MPLKSLNAQFMTKFTRIGGGFTADKETDWNTFFDQLSWQTTPCKLPMMQSMGIHGLTRKLNLPPAVRVAWGVASLAPDGCTVLAAEFKTPKQHFQVFALDNGFCLTPLAFREFQF